MRVRTRVGKHTWWKIIHCRVGNSINKAVVNCLGDKSKWEIAMCAIKMGIIVINGGGETFNL